MGQLSCYLGLGQSTAGQRYLESKRKVKALQRISHSCVTGTEGPLRDLWCEKNEKSVDLKSVKEK